MIKRNLFLILSISLSWVSAQEGIEDFRVNETNGIALEGYDAVSYFTGKPLKGKDSFQTQ
jgi:hypothetical protein